MKPTTNSAQAEPAARFAGFKARELTISRGTVHAMVDGSGPPLLLHAYPDPT